MDSSHDQPDALSNAEPLPETELLICRLVDGEATAGDHERFRRLAREDPRLVDALLWEQRRAAVLADAVEPVLDGSDAVDLPAAAAVGAHRFGALAAAGWAAVAVLTTALVVVSLIRPISEPPSDGQPVLTAEDHFDRYAEAPFVVQEIDPVLLETQRLEDGRIAVRYLRRLEEVLILDGALPLDEHGNLIEHPSELRRRQRPEPRIPD